VGRSAIPETPREIREVLRERGLAPRKRWGQNFLADANIRDAVVAAAGVGEGDLVLEVGPGLGILTRGLLDAGARVLGVELDRGFADFLDEALEGEDRFHLVRGDALRRGRLSPDVLEALAERRGDARRTLLVSNLPYSCGTPIVADAARGAGNLERAVVMVQREVALRMTGAPGSGDYGPLAVLLSLAGTARRVKEVSGAVFVPRVSVRSSVVSFVREAVDAEDLRRAEETAREAFLHRRKGIAKALVLAGHERETVLGALRAAGVSDRVRPEVVSADGFMQIGRVLSEGSGPGRFDA